MKKMNKITKTAATLSMCTAPSLPPSYSLSIYLFFSPRRCERLSGAKERTSPATTRSEASGTPREGVPEPSEGKTFQANNIYKSWRSVAEPVIVSPRRSGACGATERWGGWLGVQRSGGEADNFKCCYLFFFHLSILSLQTLPKRNLS